ncbi:MAG: metallophosphoesterase [Hyphomicrobium sp.]|jgi:hypothetical protein|nr:metallophosphoesterase [Hyphomicrobium sp.]
MQYKVFGRDKDATPQSTKGRQIIERLRAGELPQMVDWFDPHLLAKVGVRSILSSTIGSYTDQRLIQAATDPATEDELKTRYDYSGSGQPSSALRPDASGAVWVDYIADLGDGFEPTYAMAYLMAEDRLKVEGSDEPLPGGSLLVMGGDQVYPDANKHEYQTRLQDPYDWAFSSDVPQRKLFAIPGNHDWYDGLSSFSALFCSARDRISKGLGTQIGGWRCHQHRSYFAIKLPHDWWIWGPDIQLADNLDDSQRDYFDLMADQTKPGDKIILCIAEPSWLHQNYDNLHEISMLARKNGACIMAVLAGDWHHYSRYTCDRLGVQFITCGGGGAFAHATHGLRRRISLNWASLTGAPHRVSDPSDPEEFNRMERSVIGPEGPDFSLNVGVDAREPERTIPPIPFISGGGPAGAMQDAAVKLAGMSGVSEPKPISDVDAGPSPGRRAKAIRKENISSDSYRLKAAAIYPSRWKSRLLCLHNLVLPFRNQKFAMLVGIIYFVFAWVWSSSDPRHSPVMTKLAEDIAVQAQHARTEYDNIRSAITNLQNRLKDLEKASAGKPQTTEMVVLEQQLASARAKEQPALKEWSDLDQRSKAVDGGRKVQLNHQIRELESMTNLSIDERLRYLVVFFRQYSPLDEVLNPTALLAACQQGPLFAFMMLGLWALLVNYVDTRPGSAGSFAKFTIGTTHFAAHVVALLVISWIASGVGVPLSTVLKYHMPDPWPDIIRVTWNFVITLLLGGLIGGFVMGLYWTLTSTLLNMHTGDAFGALGIKNYKHFLRIRLEPDRATVYPIALDKVPGPGGWRWKLRPGEQRPSHDPLIMPKKPLDPRLIEPPVVIEAKNVLV